MIDIAATEEWRRLSGMAGAAPRMRDAFAEDPERATRYALAAAGLFVDFSKNRINDAIFGGLLALARRARLDEARARMFGGEKINKTEGRAVLHVALRDLSGVS